MQHCENQERVKLQFCCVSRKDIHDLFQKQVTNENQNVKLSLT